MLNGNQSVTVDSLGQRLPQTLHAGRFRWQRHPDTPRGIADHERCTTESPCRRLRPVRRAGPSQRTADRLALAARCTASFPVAFEPVYVPVGSPLHQEPTHDVTA